MQKSKTMADHIDVMIWFPPHHRSQKCYRNICILGSATSKITQSAIAERVHRNISRDAGTQQCHRVFFADSYHDISAYLRHHMFAFNINVCVKFQLELRKMERERERPLFTVWQVRILSTPADNRPGVIFFHALFLLVSINCFTCRSSFRNNALLLAV